MAQSINNLMGKRFEKLKVIGYTEKRKWREVVWKCQCECGNIVFMTHTELKQNISCGCHRKEHCSELGKIYNSNGRKVYKNCGKKKNRVKI